MLKKKFGAAIAAAHAVPPVVATKVIVDAGEEAEPTVEDEAPVGDGVGVEGGGEPETPELVEAPADVYATYTAAAIRKVAANTTLIDRTKSGKGIPWMGVQIPLKEALPDIYDDQDRNEIAFKLVTRFLDEAIGKDKWKTEKRPKVSGGGLTTWIVLKE